MHTLAKFGLYALTLLSVSGCFYDVEGSGHYASERYYYSGFDHIEVVGEGRLIVDFSSHEEILVSGDDNIVHHINVQQYGRTLRISTDSNLHIDPDIPLLFKVNLPALTSLTLSQASNAHIHNIQEERLAIQLSGASTLTLDGHLHQLELDVSEASHVDALTLDSYRVQGHISDASLVKLTAIDTLDVSLSGASELIYAGNPMTNFIVSSSSVVHHID
jgi:hypothetical protein